VGYLHKKRFDPEWIIWKLSDAMKLHSESKYDWMGDDFI